MHDLIALETYNDIDSEFEKSAKEDVSLLNNVYGSCTEFRAKFYEEGYEFTFPDEATEGCSCKPRETK